MALIEELAKSVPEKHTVDLENAELFILVEVFKVRHDLCFLSIERITSTPRASVALVSSRTTIGCKSST